MKSKNKEYGFDRYITVFEVEMLAFQKGVIRKVAVPTQELDGTPFHDLERIFHYGQNDFQPVADRCSVSMGDVVRYKGQRWSCDMVGFTQLAQKVRPKYEANLQNVGSGKVKAAPKSKVVHVVQSYGMASSLDVFARKSDAKKFIASKGKYAREDYYVTTYEVRKGGQP